jgi:hypothetical protein
MYGGFRLKTRLGVMVAWNPIILTIFRNDRIMFYQQIHVVHCLEITRMSFCNKIFKIVKNILNMLHEY